MFALYRASDVFLSISEHEGFCLPLIESMVFDLPVIAFNAGAVPLTLDGAGVLFRASARTGSASSWPGSPGTPGSGSGSSRASGGGSRGSGRWTSGASCWRRSGSLSDEPKDRVRRPALRPGGHGGIRAPLPARRRAAGRRRARGHGLHDDAQRITSPGGTSIRKGRRSSRASSSEGFPVEKAPGHRVLQRVFRPDIPSIPWLRTTKGNGWNARDPLRPASSRPFPARGAGQDLFIFLHLPLLQHLLGSPGRARRKGGPRPDGARRARPAGST